VAFKINLPDKLRLSEWWSKYFSFVV